MTARKFMLDTDTVSFVLRGEREVAANLTAHPPSEVCLSSLSLAELRFGADKRRSKKLHAIIDRFVSAIDVVTFDSTAAAAFGRIRARLESRGKPIGTLDTFIAAHAVSLNLILVSNNVKHFSIVPGLRTQNWCGTAG